MKNRDLVRILRDNNFNLIRSNGHSIYSNGIVTIAVPNHHEHSKGLVRRVLQQAQFDKQFIQGVL